MYNIVELQDPNHLVFDPSFGNNIVLSEKIAKAFVNLLRIPSFENNLHNPMSNLQPVVCQHLHRITPVRQELNHLFNLRITIIPLTATVGSDTRNLFPSSTISQAQVFSGEKIRNGEVKGDIIYRLVCSSKSWPSRYVNVLRTLRGNINERLGHLGCLNHCYQITDAPFRSFSLLTRYSHRFLSLWRRAKQSKRRLVTFFLKI